MNLKEKLREGKKCNSKGYFDSYTDNIYGIMSDHYQSMFDKGSGNELHSKAEAVHSSSMLSYNFLHWINYDHPFDFEGVKYSKVYFEVRMRTLKGRSNPANMDIVLEGECNGKRHLLFVESKFLEYLESSKFELSDSYLKRDKWYDVTADWDSIIQNAKQRCNRKCYGGGIKQAITHLFGIQGLKNDEARKWFNENNGELHISNLENIDIEFANFIFEPDEIDFAEEHLAYENYMRLYTEFVQNLSESIKPKWYSYSQIWKNMKTQIEDERLVRYIEDRYIQFAHK